MDVKMLKYLLRKTRQKNLSFCIFSCIYLYTLVFVFNKISLSSSASLFSRVPVLCPLGPTQTSICPLARLTAAEVSSLHLDTLAFLILGLISGLVLEIICISAYRCWFPWLCMYRSPAGWCTADLIFCLVWEHLGYKRSLIFYLAWKITPNALCIYS